MSYIGLAGWIPDHAGGAAGERDRAVAVQLKASQREQRDEIADVPRLLSFRRDVLNRISLYRRTERLLELVIQRLAPLRESVSASSGFGNVASHGASDINAPEFPMIRSGANRSDGYAVGHSKAVSTAAHKRPRFTARVSLGLLLSDAIYDGAAAITCEQTFGTAVCWTALDSGRPLLERCF
jgi:hypothetical protein